MKILRFILPFFLSYNCLSQPSGHDKQLSNYVYIAFCAADQDASLMPIVLTDEPKGRVGEMNFTICNTLNSLCFNKLIIYLQQYDKYENAPNAPNLEFPFCLTIHYAGIVTMHMVNGKANAVDFFNQLIAFLKEEKHNRKAVEWMELYVTEYCERYDREQRALKK